MLPPEDQLLWELITKDIKPLAKRTVVNLPSAPGVSQLRQTGHTLDLHGLTVAEAHARTMEFMATSRGNYKYVTVVTGTSGRIHQEFRHWLDRHPDIRSLTPLPGGGAFRITFRR